MSNKQVIAIFIVGLALLLVAFWAGLSITRRDTVTAVGQIDATGKAQNQQKQSQQNRKAPDAPASDQATGGETRYIVRVQAFGTLQKARELETELRRKYISAHTQPPGDQDSLYRVNVGPYNSREDAQQVVNELTAQGFKGVMLIPGTQN